MMATKANHKMVDLSREEPNLCIVFEEDEDNYYGNWFSRFGFVKIQFPKSTTRELTSEEVEKWHGQVTMIGDKFGPIINIKGEDFNKEVLVTKANNEEVYDGTLVAPIKVGGNIALINKLNGQTFCSSKIQSITENGSQLKVKTRNSTYFVKFIND